jgi:enoyl-CoA hydratase/carnithine racemase
MANILVETYDTVRLLRLARPEKKNAITGAMYGELHAALQAAEADPGARVVLLAGTEGAFTAGNDLTDFLQHPPTSEDAPAFGFLRALVEFPKPIVAAVDGVAVGIGTTMLLHCDIVLATARARFALPFTRLALVPEAGSSVLLPLVVGYHRAAEWLLLGQPFGGEDAYRAGFVSRLESPEELEPKALALAQALAALPPEAVRLAKRLMKDPLHDATLAAIQREAAVFVERLQSAEARDAFTAFLARK